MKSYVRFLLFVLPLFFISNISTAQKSFDLTGTWEGTIYVAEIDIEMDITLVLEEKDGIVTGKISDDWEYINCDIIDPKLDKNILTFKADVESSGSDHQMAFKMTISGDKMKGQWESRGRSFGEWDAVKKDKKEMKKYKMRDIVGTWKGPAAFKISPHNKRILSMVLEEKGGKLTGTLSDPQGTEYSQIKVKKFENDNLEMEVTFPRNNVDCIMTMNMKIKDAANMKGKFSIPDMGVTGIWKAEKQK